jgi:hypothetical protein
MGFTDGFYQAVRCFLAVGWVWIAFRGGREAFRHYRSRFKAFLLISAVCLGLAFLSRTNLGTHVEDADPVIGAGNAVTDYEPTDAQRNDAAALTFLLSFLPGLAGSLSMQKQCPNCGADMELTYKYKHPETWTGDSVFLWYCDKCKGSVRDVREAAVRRFLRTERRSKG